MVALLPKREAARHLQRHSDAELVRAGNLQRGDARAFCLPLLCQLAVVFGGNVSIESSKKLVDNRPHRCLFRRVAVGIGAGDGIHQGSAHIFVPVGKLPASVRPASFTGGGCRGRVIFLRLPALFARFHSFSQAAQLLAAARGGAAVFGNKVLPK